MKHTTPTIYGEYLQHCEFVKAPFEMFQHTTLNERKGVMAGVYPPTGVYPQINWLAIGNQGHRTINHTSGRRHMPTDGGPFNMLPFHLRPMNNDLPLATQRQYGLRKIEEYGGQQYIAYYLKKLDMSTVVPTMVIIETSNGQTTQRPFVPREENLSPTPIDLAPEEVVTANGQMIGTRSVVPIILSASEIEAIIEACRIMYDNAYAAEISEMCLVSGVEYVTSGMAYGGGSIEYTEVIAAQVAAHLITHYSLPFINRSIREDMILGNSTPLAGPTVP